MRPTPASPHDVCQTQQNDLPSFPSLIGRRGRWRFPATIIKMNHSTRDSGGNAGRGSGEEQGDRGGEGSAGYLSETMRRSLHISSCLIHLFIVLGLPSSSASVCRDSSSVNDSSMDSINAFIAVYTKKIKMLLIC